MKGTRQRERLDKGVYGNIISIIRQSCINKNSSNPKIKILVLNLSCPPNMVNKTEISFIGMIHFQNEGEKESREYVYLLNSFN